MEMTINKLPAPTWNRLGMNESRISNIRSCMEGADTSAKCSDYKRKYGN